MTRNVPSASDFGWKCSSSFGSGQAESSGSTRWRFDEANAFLFAIGHERLHLSLRGSRHQRVSVVMQHTAARQIANRFFHRLRVESFAVRMLPWPLQTWQAPRAV